MHLDGSVYPDLEEPPTVAESLGEKADYVQRVCAAWDFHVHPEPETFELFATWKDVFDQLPIPTSPAYHAFRSWFGWESVAVPTGLLGPLPVHIHLDRMEERDEDPCTAMI